MVAPALAGQRLGVFGLARSGLSVLRFLARSGASAVAWDDRADARDAARASMAGVMLEDLMEVPLDGLDGLVVSPGVPLGRHPLAARARSAGVPIIGDVALFGLARPALPPHRVVAITGTNGKSTVTALLDHLLKTAGVPSRMAGNIGRPILDEEPLEAGGVYVLELSSFQIDLLPAFEADIAIWTNLSPDHLDRHGTMEAYAAAKERLFTLQGSDASAIIAVDDAHTRAAADRLQAMGHAVVRVSKRDIDGRDQARWPGLSGPHNAQNVACAAMAARLLGVDDAAIEQGLASFPGLAHRMEVLGYWRGVRFVNDSKATNPTSAAPALEAFERIHWILGGQAKEPVELDECLGALDRVASAYAMGASGESFAAILGGRVPTAVHSTLAHAFAAAVAAARAGDTILLSPAAASFDQFSDFEARGRAFARLFAELPT